MGGVRIEDGQIVNRCCRRLIRGEAREQPARQAIDDKVIRLQGFPRQAVQPC